jgi:hypothetical protein
LLTIDLKNSAVTGEPHPVEIILQDLEDHIIEQAVLDRKILESFSVKET